MGGIQADVRESGTAFDGLPLKDLVDRLSGMVGPVFFEALIKNGGPRSRKCAGTV